MVACIGDVLVIPHGVIFGEGALEGGHGGVVLGARVRVGRVDRVARGARLVHPINQSLFDRVGEGSRGPVVSLGSLYLCHVGGGADGGGRMTDGETRGRCRDGVVRGSGTVWVRALDVVLAITRHVIPLAITLLRVHAVIQGRRGPLSGGGLAPAHQCAGSLLMTLLGEPPPFSFLHQPMLRHILHILAHDL